MYWERFVSHSFESDGVLQDESNAEDGLFRGLFLFMSELIWEADVLLNLLKTNSCNDC